MAERNYLAESIQGAKNALLFLHEQAKNFGDVQTGRPTRVRLRPNTPPLQDAYHRARRKKRKTAHESRRRNRL